MRNIIYIFIGLLCGCATSPYYNGNPSQSSQDPTYKVSSGKKVADIIDAGLSGQPQYRQSALGRQQLEYMRLENERMAMQNEMMRRELNQYQNGG